MTLMPDHDNLLIHHILALNECGDYEDKIRRINLDY